MKIGILGRHPVPQPGFMGVMSIFEAIYLSRLGHDVTLILPFESDDDLKSLTASQRIKDVGDLDRLNGNFSIIHLLRGARLRERFDVIIWQSYERADYENFFGEIRRSATVLTKNFPKFVPGPKLAMHETVESSFKQFDLVACALREDVDELRAHPEFWHRYGHKVAYVPRGADPVLLHPGRKLGRQPVIALEIPFADDALAAIDFYLEPLRLVRAAIPGLRILTLGAQPHPAIASEHIPFGRFDRIYEGVFNEAWLYLVMDYRLSPQHVAAPVQRLHPAKWSGRALYEVQNIEAQMAGSVIIGHPDNLIPELISVGASAFFVDDYADAVQISRLMQAVIANFPILSIQARGFALANFTWEACIFRWAAAMEAALSRIRRPG